MLRPSKSYFNLAAPCLLLIAAGCSRSDSAEDTLSVSPAADSVPAPETEEPFLADNDIGMAVRSMANTINIGEGLDSTEYNFEGVLTDGIGMPLFTDMTGMPGQWEVEVVDSTRVRIRNLGPGNLQPFQLIDYLTATLGDDSNTIRLEEELDKGESHILHYRYGRTSMRVEMRPQPIGDTGEVAPVMEITLSADSIPDAYES